MPTLYSIADELAHVLNTIPDDGEIPDELGALLDALQLDLRTKVEHCCRAVRIAEAEEATFTTEVDRLKALAKSARSRVAWLKGYVWGCLGKVGLTKLDTELFRVAVQNNSRPSIRLLEGAPIPAAFLRVKEELDGDAAYRAWKAGETLPAELVVEQGTHLRIR